jgi:xanthine dehydrogenase YagT iron-sulfur-binding subunit
MPRAFTNPLSSLGKRCTPNELSCNRQTLPVRWCACKSDLHRGMRWKHPVPRLSHLQMEARIDSELTQSRGSTMKHPICTLTDQDDEATTLLGQPESSSAPLTATVSRRVFMKSAGALGAGVAAGFPKMAAAQEAQEVDATPSKHVDVMLRVNGQSARLSLDTRTTLLDALRESMGLTGSKKGCDHGQCGACTVLVDGRRVNSCLTLALSASVSDITTIEGLAKGDDLSAVQTAFAQHDGFQCGYCTPGQICSATALAQEASAGQLSQVSWHTANTHQPEMTDDEIRERMSGNICRCGAYPNIVAAVRAVVGKGASA